MGPVYANVYAQTGNPAPLNAMAKAMCEYLDIPPDEWLLPVREPPQPEGAGQAEQAQAQAQVQARQAEQDAAIKAQQVQREAMTAEQEMAMRGNEHAQQMKHREEAHQQDMRIKTTQARAAGKRNKK
jgi:hypothetical protein